MISNTPASRPSKISKALLSLALAGGLLALQTGSASAISSSVKMACMGDYFSYCSMHAVGSQALRACMNDNGHRLSKRCVNALIGAGEVSQTEVSRRAASAR
jgi:hypothetical protein